MASIEFHLAKLWICFRKANLREIKLDKEIKYMVFTRINNCISSITKMKILKNWEMEEWYYINFLLKYQACAISSKSLRCKFWEGNANSKELCMKFLIQDEFEIQNLTCKFFLSNNLIPYFLLHCSLKIWSFKNFNHDYQKIQLFVLVKIIYFISFQVWSP